MSTPPVVKNPVAVSPLSVPFDTDGGGERTSGVGEQSSGGHRVRGPEGVAARRGTDRPEAAARGGVLWGGGRYCGLSDWKK